MPSLITPLHCLRATHFAARGRLARCPAALVSVLRARSRFGIGPRLHSLFDLIDVPHETWSDYLLDERLRVVLRRINPPERRAVATNKLAFYEHCVAHGISTIPVLCATASSSGNAARHTPIVRSAQEWQDELADHGEALFLKLIDGTWGEGAFSARRDPSERHWHFCGRSGSLADIYHHCTAGNKQRGWLVQPLTCAHERLRAAISPQALSTVRIITTRNRDGQASMRFAFLRIPVGDSATDNFAHGLNGNLIAAVDLATGRLSRCRGSLSRKWPEIVEVRAHPDTGREIEGFELPLWDQIGPLVIRAHETLPGLKALAWDVAITDVGALVVEVNTTFDVSGLQVAHQRGVGPDLGPSLVD